MCFNTNNIVTIFRMEVFIHIKKYTNTTFILFL
nr:ALPV-285 [Albatrosspox virus]